MPAGPNGTERRYVLTGAGEVPVRRQVEALARTGYGGYYSVEWEKRWHPEIEAPEIAIARFATVASEYLRAAAVPAISGDRARIEQTAPAPAVAALSPRVPARGEGP